MVGHSGPAGLQIIAMAANSTAELSPEYLAESKVTLLNVFYSLPIALEVLSTFFRIWVKARPSSTAQLAFDDYLIIGAMVCCAFFTFGIQFFT